MASVAPQQTVTCSSASVGMPLYDVVRCAIARRRAGAPQVTAYWLMSASMARLAASLSGSGAGKSGKPWARLRAPSRVQTRDISRMTDSVKRAALTDVGERSDPAGTRVGEPLTAGDAPT